MHGVVSLLDDAQWQAVAGLWDELEQMCKIKRLRKILPYPHVSYHVAQEYDFDRLDVVLTRLATTSAPFVVQTTGSASSRGPVRRCILPSCGTQNLRAINRRSGRRWLRHM